MAVLVIDDDPAMRALIRLLLEKNGFEVVEAADGEKGVAQVQASDVDLAIVDLFMPNMDGLEVIRIFRQIRPGLPILAISGSSFWTGESKFDFLKAAVAFGAVKTLSKPFKPAELLGTVTSLLASHASQPRHCAPADETAQLDLFADH